MWKAQSYLFHPNIRFPVYVYVFAGRYTHWDDASYRRLLHILTVLGSETGNEVCVIAPIDQQRSQEVREYLNECFLPLAKRLGLGGESFGLLVCDTPVPDLEQDGRNGRWVWFRFDPDLNLQGGQTGIGAVADAIRDGSIAGGDRIQTIFRSVSKADLSLWELVKDIDWSLSGPSTNLRTLLRGAHSVETNLYD